jgi:hypothetical protein
MEKRTFHAERRSYTICESFKCIYADEEDCRVAGDRKKAVSECPSKLVYCAKAYCSHCSLFKTEECPREQRKKVTVTVEKQEQPAEAAAPSAPAAPIEPQK